MYALRYTQAQNETASPERLMVLLFEAALRHMRSAAASLDAGRGDVADALSKAADIVAHLDATFDRGRFPELADNLGAVYRFTCQRLISANVNRDPRLVRDAERIFAPIADAFATAVRQTSAGGTR